MNSIDSAFILTYCLTMQAVNGWFLLPWVLETEMIFPLTLPIYN